MSSLTAGTLQLMYKKKSSNNLPSSGTTSSSSSTNSLSNKNTQKKMPRSRSHSRGKYSSYLASAASVFRTAKKQSPTSSKNILNSISTQTSSSISLSSNESNVDNNIRVVYEESNFIDGRPIKTALPSRSDFFIWYSSVRGFASHREFDGSPFIKCLVTVFSRCAYELELIEMVRKVNLLMQQYEMRNFDEKNSLATYFMAPVPEFHLTKRLYFNP